MEKLPRTKIDSLKPDVDKHQRDLVDGYAAALCDLA